MRTVLLLSACLAVAMLAGCTAPTENGDAMEDTRPDTTGDTMEDKPDFEPAPKGDGLSSEEIRNLALAFDDNVLTGGQDPWPAHRTKWVNEDTFVFLQLDNADPFQATELLWMGMGVRGVFCADNQPGPEFTHFHRYSAPTYPEGHGGEDGQAGYWLSHVAISDFESPFGPTGGPGLQENYAVTPAPDCNPSGRQLPPAGDGIDVVDRVRINNAFDDEPLRGGQDPWPGHLLKWATEDVFVLLHFADEDPTVDSDMLWAGIGVRSTFCASTQPDEFFTHFHRSHAGTYAEGHGGDANQPGYWLLHMNVKEFESPFGPTGRPGIQENFGVTPAPDC